MKKVGLAQINTQSQSTFREILSTPRITSHLVIFLFSLNVVVSGFLTTAPANRSIGMSWHLIDLANASISAVSLLFLNSHFIMRPKLDLLTKFIFLVGGCALGIIASPIIILVSTHHAPNFIYIGVLIGIISNVSSLITTTILVVAISDSRKSMKQVRSNRNTLRAIEEGLHAEFKEVRNSILGEVTSTVSNIVDELRQNINLLSEKLKRKEEILNIFKRNIDEVIRPFSHRIENETNNFTLERIPKIYSKESIIGFFKNRIDTQIAINPTFIAMNLINIVLLSYIFLIDLKAMLLLGMPAILISLLFVAAIRRFFRDKEVSLVLSLILAFFISITITLIFIEINKLFGKGYDATDLITLNKGTFYTMVLISIATVALAARSKFIEEAAFSNRQILISLSSTRQNLWAFRKKIARDLHGGVQRNLQSAAIKLARASEISTSLISDLKENLDEAVNSILPKPTSKDLNFLDSLEILKNLWGGICEIDLSISRDVIDVVELYPFSKACALEVINEGVTNSVKHGDAKEIKLEVQILADLILELKISNENPRGKLLHKSEGLGWKIIDESSLSWHAEVIDTKFVLSALINLTKV